MHDNYYEDEDACYGHANSTTSGWTVEANKASIFECDYSEPIRLLFGIHKHAINHACNIYVPLKCLKLNM